MCDIGLIEDAIYRFCQEEVETPIYILFHYVDLAITRFLIVGLENSKVLPKEASFKDESPVQEGKIGERFLEQRESQ